MKKKCLLFTFDPCELPKMQSTSAHDFASDCGPRIDPGPSWPKHLKPPHIHPPPKYPWCVSFLSEPRVFSAATSRSRFSSCSLSLMMMDEDHVAGANISGLLDKWLKIIPSSAGSSLTLLNPLRRIWKKQIQPKSVFHQPHEMNAHNHKQPPQNISKSMPKIIVLLFHSLRSHPPFILNTTIVYGPNDVVSFPTSTMAKRFWGSVSCRRAEHRSHIGRFALFLVAEGCFGGLGGGHLILPNWPADPCGRNVSKHRAISSEERYFVKELRNSSEL